MHVYHNLLHPCTYICGREIIFSLLKKLFPSFEYCHFSSVLHKYPRKKMHCPWTRSMPSPPENNFTQMGNNFAQGQTSQQSDDSAFSQVCRLYEQSQQQHQEMMQHLMNMGNHCRGILTADARGWLIVGGAMRASTGSGSEIEHELEGTRDVPRFGALRRDNTPNPAMVTMIRVVQACS
jgi:hypothetical protein